MAQYHAPKIGMSYEAQDYEGQGSHYAALEAEANKFDYESLQQKYQDGKKDEKPSGTDYQRLERDEQDKKESIEKNIAEEEKVKKYDKNEQGDDEIVRKAAAIEINHEIQKTSFEKGKKSKTIEDAIKSAIKQEKEVRVM